MADVAFLETLSALITARLEAAPGSSYSARLASQGIAKVAQKVGEEGVELALAAVADSDRRVTEETADLLYHVLLLLAVRGVPLAAVTDELKRRHREKAAAAG